MAVITIEVTPDDLDVGRWFSGMAPDENGGADTGAVVTFAGYCRGEEGRLIALELEHYPGMAESEMRRIAGEAAVRWPVQRICAVHRAGVVPVGAPIVFVAASSAHRDAAFDAARFLMDFLKTSAPFWKREHLADGALGPWVEAKAQDDLAAARWETAE